MSTRLRSSKRTRKSVSNESTPSTRERNKRERRKATVIAAPTTVAAECLVTATTTTTPQRSFARLDHADDATERIDIKVEPLDLTSDGEVEAIDVKPDVAQLQQALMLQQHDVVLPSAAVANTATQPTQQQPSGGSGKRVYIIGDLATLTSLANSGSSIALGCLAGAAADGSSIAVGGSSSVGAVAPTAVGCTITHAANAFMAPNATHPATANSTTSAAALLSAKTLASTAATAATSSPIAMATARAKTLSDVPFEKDDFDLQQSDMDEDGYSDIDFDEDEFVEDDTEFDMYDSLWTDQATAPRLVFPFDLPPNDVGLKGKPQSTSPIFYFNKMLGDFGVFFGLLATGTNERVHQMFDLNAPDTEECIKDEITADDLRCFVALCLQMSSLQLPTLADYWNEQTHCGFIGFASVMSEQRFRLIMHTLNFEHIGQGDRWHTLMQKIDPLAEVRPLVEFFNQRMTDIYACGQRVVLNDPIVYWQGRCHWQREMSERFRCNAVSLHLLTEFTGLVLRIVPEVDVEERKQLTRNSKFLLQHRMALAKELLQSKFGKGYTVYASKYYGSCGLAYELANQQTYCTGLLDNKRYGNCKELVLNPLKENAIAIKYASPIMMGKWRRQEKCVYFYSSDCLAIYANETAWHSRDRRPKIIKELEWQLQLPENIKRAMTRYQPTIERKDIKWHRHVAIYILNVMLLNSYILYTMYAPVTGSRLTELHLKDTSKLKSYSEFRQFVIGWLLGMIPEEETDVTALISNIIKQTKPQTRPQTRPQKRSHSTVETNGDAGEQANVPPIVAAKKIAEVQQHVPKEVQRKNGKILKRKCRVCRRGGMRSLTKFFCDVCPGRPGLCGTPCFEIWHEQLRQSLA